MKKESIRMYGILSALINTEGAEFVYAWEDNTLLYCWPVGDAQGNFAYVEYGTCVLDQWFNERDQEDILDLVTPLL